ncbi:MULTISPECIES: peptidoglycan-binding domain-containing protein [unclassified Tolypothrix]|uniref:peptidoglycan-binding domain-containing protein n=1 Tax=unclassified Tolypothrix TaxID=2649714 RepID=UPI0005EAB85D|nr:MULTISPECIES: peptidoglycan-binding domain-containing protein [unclassified Tolypothrix]BAY95252.1 peptidoglycan binding domain-containing protein [Microchaete diplosiphon NIES-3275]EKE98125.1 hypothetical protein FDUTEX481_04272 [Tolypothrix sp. PCC 7601]MBE9086000.1 peptidoglycan-binding protein [Tolypothrix sp. LEGE 11397]UYD30477.1 peptidoglycan-binding protein [Tolypothrix sp. PCC 7712]UYD38389.1 peptidoglycan-binding protein [Tolypothrix sp. PCC 7601]
MEILVKGSKGYLVKLLQSYLQVLRYYSGKIDSDYGDMTQDAVDKFQTDVGIGPKEGVDDDTWNKLEQRLEPITKNLELQKFVQQIGDAQGAIETAKNKVETAQIAAENAKKEAESAKTAIDKAKNEAELASGKLVISASVVKVRESARRTGLIYDAAIALYKSIQNTQTEINEIIKTAKENVAKIRLTSPKSEADNADKVVANAEKQVKEIPEKVKNAESLKSKVENKVKEASEATEKAEAEETKVAIPFQNLTEVQNAVAVQEKAAKDAETAAKEALKDIQSAQQTISELKAKVEEDVQNLGNNEAASPIPAGPSNFSPLWDLFNQKDNLPLTSPPAEAPNQPPDGLGDINLSTLIHLFELDKSKQTNK